MPAGQAPDLAVSFRFHVEIQGIEVARFTECGGLEFEQATLDYAEGGVNSRVHRLPGRFRFANLALKRGIATDGGPLMQWLEESVQASNRGRQTTHTVTLTLYDASGRRAVRTWVFQDAYPVRWSAVPFTAEQSVIAIETLTLAHQGMSFAQ